MVKHEKPTPKGVGTGVACTNQPYMVGVGVDLRKICEATGCETTIQSLISIICTELLHL